MTIEVDKESKLLPIFVPIPKKDSVSALAALKEALTLCQDRNLHLNLTRSQARELSASKQAEVESGEFNNQKLKDLRFRQEHCAILLSCPSTFIEWHC